ncbi:MAG TPA: lipocalin family protein [Flavisolibacter sp.]|nr:lipocalin family protein [Flavisolibacter sp.]
MKILPSLFCLVLFGALFSCKKKSDPEENLQVKTDYITASAWVYENAGIDNNRDGTIDLPISSLAPGMIQACQADNRLTFRKDNTATADEGPTKCNSTDQQSTTFNWSFADNETNLTISNNVFSLLNGKSKIVTLNATSLSLSRDTAVAPFGNVTLVVILKH